MEDVFPFLPKWLIFRWTSREKIRESTLFLKQRSEFWDSHVQRMNLIGPGRWKRGWVNRVPDESCPFPRFLPPKKKELVATQRFCKFSPRQIGKWSNLTNIKYPSIFVQLFWNHQLEKEPDEGFCATVVVVPKCFWHFCPETWSRWSYIPDWSFSIWIETNTLGRNIENVKEDDSGRYCRLKQKSIKLYNCTDLTMRYWIKVQCSWIKFSFAKATGWGHSNRQMCTGDMCKLKRKGKTHILQIWICSKACLL